MIYRVILSVAIAHTPLLSIVNSHLIVTTQLAQIQLLSICKTTRTVQPYQMILHYDTCITAWVIASHLALRECQRLIRNLVEQYRSRLLMIRFRRSLWMLARMSPVRLKTRRIVQWGQQRAHWKIHRRLTWHQGHLCRISKRSKIQLLQRKKLRFHLWSCNFDSTSLL